GPGDRIARGLDDLVAGRDRRLLEGRRGPHVRERRRQATGDLRIGRSYPPPQSGDRAIAVARTEPPSGSRERSTIRSAIGCDRDLGHDGKAGVDAPVPVDAAALPALFSRPPRSPTNMAEPATTKKNPLSKAEILNAV